MNPLLLWKLGAGLALVLALAGAGWKVNEWRNDAAKVDQLQQDVRDARAAAKAAQDAQLAATQADAGAARDAAAAVERVAAAFDRLRAMPPAVLVKEPDNANCDAAGLSDDFRLRFDAAATAGTEP